MFSATTQRLPVIHEAFTSAGAATASAAAAAAGAGAAAASSSSSSRSALSRSRGGLRYMPRGQQRLQAGRDNRAPAAAAGGAAGQVAE